jgi:3-hydroxyisobutyrate dehydrogenase-like beta-hydroxyacid dehydrogenase
MQVGFIGLGDQGAPIAHAIARAGHPLTLWARRPRSLDELVGKFPFAVADSVASLGAAVDVVALCVDRDSDVEELLLDKLLLDSMPAGTVIVNHGTGSPAAASRFAQWAHEREIIALDAPVSGGAARGWTRTLTVMVGGDASGYARCEGLFRAYGSVVAHLGPPGSGQLAKLINNVLLAMNMCSAHQALAVAGPLGLDPENLAELILASSGSSRALEQLVRTDTELLEHFEIMLDKDVSEFAAAGESGGVAVTDLVSVARRGVAGIRDTVRWRSGRAEHYGPGPLQ